MTKTSRKTEDATATEAQWRRYVIDMIAAEATYGDAALLENILGERPARDQKSIRLAIKQLKARKAIITVGRGVYELRDGS